jgi:biotin-dependent carboxylase-like uncharacterized protein
MTLRITRAGPACTVQDAGRHGYLRFGITPAGPMDWIAHATANWLADNGPGAAAVEIGPGGLSATAAAPVRVALSARGFRVARNGNPLPTRVAVTLHAGDRLDVLPGPENLWAYLALPGGIACAPVMGSRSSHLRSGLGPMGALAAGDTVSPAGASAAPDLCLIDPAPPPAGTIRYVPGPQADRFAPGTHALFAAATWTVAAKSDRMAYRLSGPAIAAIGGHDIVSDGIALGAIQVPGDGQPFVLMADRQPTGGYPKLGTVIRADLPRLAQTRPGQPLRMTPVPVDQAVSALRAATPDPARLKPQMRHLRTVPAGGPHNA